MIFIMSKKYFKNHILNEEYTDLSLAWPMEYLVIDGDCHVVSGTTGSDAISSIYANAHVSPGLCPETEFWNLLLKVDSGQAVSKHNLEKELDKFLKSTQFCHGIATIFKAQISGGRDTRLNVFVVLPNLVWSYLGGYIIKTIREYMNLSFDCVFTQLDLEKQLKENGYYPLLWKAMSEDDAREIYRAVETLEKDRDLHYQDDTDQYGNPLVIPQQGQWTPRVRHLQTAADNSWYM